MATVESRILTMKFDNKDFLTAASVTMAAISKLKDAMNFGSSQKALQNVGAEASKVNLNNLEQSAGRVSTAFLGMATVAITALANITNRAVDAGISLVKSLTLEPVMQGFQEYELNIRSIQTILANTNDTNLRQVNDALDELNEYADKTIYNFAEMTRNIGTFTAAGVNLDTSVQSIKGLANLAAISGSSSQQASTAMYQLSQAIAAGSVKLMDWNSVVNAGMGGQVFQKALFETGKALGTIENVPIDTTFKQWTDAGNTFRGSLEKGWVTSEVLTTTLQGFTGEMSKAELQAKGFTAEQIAQIQELGKTGVEAATKVRTFTQLMDTAKEAVASGWSESFRTVIGNFNQATNLFTRISTVFGNITEESSSARNELLSGWAKAGGRTDLIEGLANIFKGLGSVLQTVREAFRDVFPRTTVDDLVNMTARFREFTEGLIPSQETLEQIGRIATGVFSALSIGIKVIKGIAGFIFDLAAALFGASGGFLEIAAKVGDFFKKVDDGVPQVSVLSGVVESVTTGVQGLSDAFKRFGDFVAPILSQIGEFGKSVRERFSEVFAGIDWSSIFTLGGAAGAGALAVAIRKLVSEGFGVSLDLSGGFLDSVKDSLQGLTGVLEGMQQNLKANALLKIAGAIAILAGALVILSMINAADLAKAIGAMSAGFAVLLGGMAIMDRIVDSPAAVKMPALAAGLVLLSTSLLILAAALKRLSGLSWEEIAKGLVGIAGGLLALTKAANALAKDPKGLIRAGLGIIAIATAMVILAQALEDLAALSWSDLARGLTAVAAALIVISQGMKMMPPLKGQAVSLVIIAGALLLLSKAIQSFAGPELKESGKGLLVMAAALVILAKAMSKMPTNMLANAAALLVLSGALLIISKVVQTFGGMSIGEIAKGLITLALALTIIGVALAAMSGTMAGAGALLVAAAAIAIFIPVITSLSELSWGDLVKSLISFTIAMTLLFAAGVAFGSAAPLIAAGGAALIVFGLGLSAVGAASLIFAAAFYVAIKAVQVGVQIIRDGFEHVATAIPRLANALARGMIEFVATIGKGATELVKAFSALLGALLDAVIQNVPKMGQAFRTLVLEGIKNIRALFPTLITVGFEMLVRLMRGIRDNIPQIVRLGSDIVVRFLNGLASNMNRIVTAGVNVVVKFINGVSNNMSRVVNAGINLITRFIREVSQGANKLVNEGADAVIKFINGVATTIRNRSGDLRAAGANLAGAIIDGMTGGLASGVGRVVAEARRIAIAALQAAKDVFGINSPARETMLLGRYFDDGLVVGLDNNSKQVQKSAARVGNAAISAMKASLKDMDKMMDGDLNIRPVVAPVLDLTSFRKDAATANALLRNGRLTPQVSVNRAGDIAQARAVSAQAFAQQAELARQARVEFKQYNNSPKALSALEIYRNTRNQLDLAKEALSQL